MARAGRQGGGEARGAPGGAHLARDDADPPARVAAAPGRDRRRAERSGRDGGRGSGRPRRRDGPPGTRRPEHVRPDPPRRAPDCGAGRREPGRDAPRDGDAALRRAGRARGGPDARGRARADPASGRAHGRYGQRRRRRDDEGVHRGRPLGAPARAQGHRVHHEGGARMTKMLGSDAIVRSLELAGAESCFGIPGGAILPTYDAFYRAYKNGSSLRHVLTRHEQGAGHMAEGYARASGKAGVAIATSGPGATNLVTPIADAWMDSTPLVCITGQVPSQLIGTDAFQETDATGITLPIVKHSWLVQDADEIAHAIKAAFHVATTGRCGPVLVDITKDAQQTELDFAWPDAVDLPGWNPPAKVNGRQIAEAAKAILAAKQPIFYVGGGVLNGEATEELRTLVELTGIPVVTTLMGKGAFPDSHPLCFGHPGMHGGKWGNWALNKADLIIAVGVRFDDRVTGKVSTFAPDAKFIHFDIDAAEISNIRGVNIPLVG